MINGTGDDDNGAGNDDNDTGTYILKAKKFAEPAFQSKKVAGKSAGHFWAILGHSRAILGLFGHVWATAWHFWTNLRRVQIFLGSRDSLLECMYW